MILLDDVLAGPALAFAWQELFALEVTDRTDVSGILVDIDYPWSGDVRSAQHFAKKVLGCSSAAGLIQKEIECLASRVNGSVEIHPPTFDFDIGLVNSPGIVGLFQIRAAAFIELGCITLDPAINSGVIQRQAPFRHHFLQIAITQRVAKMPPDC